MGELNYLPTIVDRTFGDYYRDFTVDYPAVIQRMREEGMTDEQIKRIQLRLSSDKLIVPSQHGDQVVAAAYRPSNEEIVIYQSTKAGELQEAAALRAFIDTARQTINGEAVEQDLEEHYLALGARAVGAEMSASLYHEIRHVRQQQQSIEQGHETTGKKTARLLGIEGIRHALAEYFAPATTLPVSEVTEHRANEQSAREAEIDAPHTLISVQYRTFDETKVRHELIDYRLRTPT